MSWTRVFIWTCDFHPLLNGVPKDKMKEGYGFPPGWKYYYLYKVGIVHACLECEEDLRKTSEEGRKEIMKYVAERISNPGSA